jgi:outer membrane lipoprotein LolB
MSKIIQQRIFIALFLFCFAFLNGCAIFAPVGQQKEEPAEHYLSKKARQAQLQNIKYWQINGVMSITYRGKNDIVNFAWEQNKANYVIDFYGPLHIGGAKIAGDENAVTLWKSANEKITAETPEELMLSQFGWELPLSEMKYWILALASPDFSVDSANFDSYNHLAALEQQNWQIKYTNFKSVSAIDLPTKIYLSSPTIKTKIVVKSWQLTKNNSR